METDPMIPFVVKVYLDLEKTGEPRDFIKTLPSHKYLLDDKIAKETKGMEDFKRESKQNQSNEGGAS